MFKPLVSIITPSYNQDKYIEDCILSVKNQTFQHIEHIIVDACSTDKTDEIINKHLNTYNLKYLMEPDDGPAHALNKGFNLAKGDIFCWLNSDDFYLHKEVIQTVVDYFSKYENMDVITGCGYHVDNNGKWIRPIITDHKKISYDKMKYADAMLQPSTFWKKDVHVSLDKQLHFTFDWVFFLQLFINGANVLSVHDYFSAYRVHVLSRTVYDSAGRKKEVAGVLKNNFGIISVQYLWGVYIYMLYKMAEITRLQFIKNFAILSNQIMNKLTSGRVISG